MTRGAGLVVTVVVAVLVTRVGLILALDHLVGGAEFTDDVGMHLDMASRPFALLAGDTETHGQHPVLLPTVEWLLVRPFRDLGGLWPVRLAYVVAEALLAAGLVALGRTDAQRRTFGVVAVVSPVLWMGTAVMAQDEVIAAAVLAAGLALWIRDRDRAAVAVVGIGVAAAKVFLLLPLVVLVLVGPRVGRGARAAIGLAAAGVPYLIAAIAATLRGDPLPLQGFTPDAAFGINPWVFVLDGGGLSLGVAKPLSLALGLGLAAVPVALTRPWRDRDPEVVGAVMAAVLLAFFVGFYHATPEYLVLVVPPLCLVSLAPTRIAAAHAALALAWVVNVFYGVETARATGDTGGKAELVRVYTRLTDLDPGTGRAVAVVASSAALVALAVALTSRAARRSRPGDPGTGDRASRPVPASGRTGPRRSPPPVQGGC